MTGSVGTAKTSPRRRCSKPIESSAGSLQELPDFGIYDRMQESLRLAVGEVDGEAAIVMEQSDRREWTPKATARLQVSGEKILVLRITGSARGWFRRPRRCNSIPFCTPIITYAKSYFIPRTRASWHSRGRLVASRPSRNLHDEGNFRAQARGTGYDLGAIPRLSRQHKPPAPGDDTRRSCKHGGLRGVRQRERNDRNEYQFELGHRGRLTLA